MIVHDFVVVERPTADVKKTLLSEIELLSESAASAQATGERLRLRVGPGGSEAFVAKTVAMHAGMPIAHGDVTTIPLLWEAVGTPSLFPRMDASLEIAPLGASLTQVSFYGRYDPPLGRVGGGLDRMLLHRLAEYTVRAFLGETAARLDTLAEVRAS